MLKPSGYGAMTPRCEDARFIRFSMQVLGGKTSFMRGGGDGGDGGGNTTGKGGIDGSATPFEASNAVFDLPGGGGGW